MLVTSHTYGQNNCLDKKLSLYSGHTTLKAVLKQMSDQTACVFSYDPTLISEKTEIYIPSSGSVTLRSALAKVLPKTIKYKTTGKYIVLLKATSNPGDDKQVKKTNKTTIGKPDNFISGTAVPTTKTDTDTVSISPVSTTVQAIQIAPDTASTKQQVTEVSLSNVKQAVEISKSDTLKLNTVKLNGQNNMLAFQLGANNHLATLSTRIGLNNMYGIISLGSDYYKSYHLGVGVGICFQLYKRLGANIDAIQYTLIAGKSKQINVKAYTTEINPALNYRIGNRLMVTLGTVAYSIRSKYSKGSSITSLGRYLGLGGMFGLSYNFGKN
jgi:hypothetical protein